MRILFWVLTLFSCILTLRGRTSQFRGCSLIHEHRVIQSLLLWIVGFIIYWRFIYSWLTVSWIMVLLILINLCHLLIRARYISRAYFLRGWGCSFLSRCRMMSDTTSRCIRLKLYLFTIKFHATIPCCWVFTITWMFPCICFSPVHRCLISFVSNTQESLVHWCYYFFLQFHAISLSPRCCWISLIIWLIKWLWVSSHMMHLIIPTIGPSNFNNIIHQQFHILITSHLQLNHFLLILFMRWRRR